MGMENNDIQNDKQLNDLDKQPDDEQKPEGQGQPGPDDVKKFSQKDIDKIIDRKIKQFKRKLEEEKNEAAKLAAMSEQERAQHELEKQKAEFEVERKKFQREKLEMETVKQLAAEKLPTDFSKFLLGVDAEETKNNLASFKTAWQEAIQAAVDERLKGSVPQSGSAGNGITKEQFRKMGVVERSKLFKENPGLYKKLNG